MSVCCAAIAGLLTSCSAGLPATHDAQQAETDVAGGTPYSIVFVIHGDGDYLYHDSSGNEYEADEVALEGAKRVAEQNPKAAVYIFHQRPQRRFLFLFPLHNGEFYYYRNGRLVAHEAYWRNQVRPRFDSEVELYHRFHAASQREMVRMLYYCGHEIPEFGGIRYDASSPDRKFTVHDLAEGLRGFTRDSARYDLMVLATCYGGTPFTVGTLGPFARYIVASPVNLHLSYFDLHSLERLDAGLSDGDVAAFARTFARQAFDRLAGDIQTAVGVAVYDVARVQGYLQSVRNEQDSALVTAGVVEHCDCADIPAYAQPTMNTGVDVFYRPANFGRLRLKAYHSGWECRKEPEPGDTTSKVAGSVLE